MELILKKTIDTLGEVGDVVKVKDGFGRNFLIPHGKAVMANKMNLAILEQEKSAIEAKKAEIRSASEALAKKISGITVVIEHRAGEENKLFGSVTSADIAAKMAALGVEIDKKKILLDEPIKTLGEIMVNVKVGYQMNTEVKVQIVPLTETKAE
ncbi:MAG: 50S ribosomal protein L9 [Proteobacteria bacterium]|nr:50S ribosomal protein L9 [Pseudomonadota bacterium]MBU1716278.1 50S ribosomal protein L9 [Pseudomonadota bacterium]